MLAELAGAGPQARTVLLYAHFDGQPVIPENWSQPDPFRPVVKRRDAQGKWQEVGRQQLQASPLDPELRVFARSASDDKAPIMMLLTAVDLLRAQQKSPAINVKVLLDPEEEMSSPSLAGMIERDRAAFAADALVILDGPQHDSGRSTIVFGNRGITQATLTVFGPRAPLHSGHFGNYAPNPAMRLARLLASMKDDNGRVLVKGYYDGVSLSSAERASLAAVGDDEAALRKRIGIARAEKVGENYQEALQYPSLNVRGMAAAGVGAKAANIVPSEAVAEIDIRTTPTTDGRKLFELIKRHIEQQGYHLVDQAPTDEERATYDKLASFRLGSVQSGVAHADGCGGRTVGVRRAEVADCAESGGRAGAHPHDGRHGADRRARRGAAAAVRADPDRERRQQPARAGREPARRPFPQRHRDRLQSADDAMKLANDIERFRANLVDELNGAALYNALAAAEPTRTGATSSCSSPKRKRGTRASGVTS